MSQAAFELPRELEATEPPEARGLPRDAVALLVSDATAGTHTTTSFARIDDYLEEGDLLVVNDSATLAAALEARRSDGSACAIHLATRIDASLWIVEPRRAAALCIDETLELAGGGTIRLIAPVHDDYARLWYASLALPLPLEPYLVAHGRPIAYGYVAKRWPIESYQTIFARTPGSVEMPSADRPFTAGVVALLRRRKHGDS